MLETPTLRRTVKKFRVLYEIVEKEEISINRERNMFWFAPGHRCKKEGVKRPFYRGVCYMKRRGGRKGKSPNVNVGGEIFSMRKRILFCSIPK